MMRLLKLPEFVMDAIEKKDISTGHAKILAGIKDEDKIIKLALLIMEKHISVRELEEILKQEPAASKDKKSKPSQNDIIKNIESNLKTYFGTKVNIKDKNGKGKIIIDYLSTDDLNRVLEVLGIEL
jgi:ParB family chromosome partitioning protein